MEAELKGLKRKELQSRCKALGIKANGKTTALIASLLKASKAAAPAVVEMEVEEERVALIVHDIKPPFLDGRTVFTKQVEAVQVVKDPTSDFVQISKKGSQLLKQIREQNDRTKMREKFWDLAGTKMGNLLKVQKKPEDQQVEVAQKTTEEGEVDYKADNQYAAALKSQKN